MLPNTVSRLNAADRVARYELLFPLGKGGQAEVWCARLADHAAFEKRVVLKFIRLDEGDTEAARGAFLDEARIGAAVSHPNVAQVLEVGTHHDWMFLALEWVLGDSLARIARWGQRQGEGGLAVRIVLRVLADAAAGLHAAHELKDDAGLPLQVVHRDVAPENIIVAQSGHTKVIDFGIAAARVRLSQTTNMQQVKGRLRFMSPEQADPGRLGGQRIDRRADVFSLAAVLFYCLTGRGPFEQETDAQTLRELIGATTPPAIPPGVPTAVAQLLDRALDPNRRARPATALEFKAAMEEAIEKISGDVTPEDVARYLQPYMAAMGDQHARARAAVEPALAANPQLAAAKNAGLAPVAALGNDTTAPLTMVTAPARSRSWLGAVGALVFVAGVAMVLLLRTSSKQEPPLAPSLPIAAPVVIAAPMPVVPEIAPAPVPIVQDAPEAPVVKRPAKLPPRHRNTKPVTPKPKRNLEMLNNPYATP
jgi:serine/threonine-protein kinase